MIATRLGQAVILRAHLKMHVAGMRHSRLKATDILRAATRLTGQPYRKGEYKEALRDVQQVIDTAEVRVIVEDAA